LIRVPNGELALGTRCLDGGGLGIVIPHVDTADEARAMVDAFRFQPLGHRSIGGGYPQFGFAAVPAQEVVKALNDATLVVAMMETPRAIENADAIAAVPGIDVLLMGTNDLCLEMDIPGQLDNERVVAAIDTVIGACKKHGKWPGLGGVYGKELMKRYIGRGMRFVLCGSDLSVLLAAAQEHHLRRQAAARVDPLPHMLRIHVPQRLRADGARHRLAVRAGHPGGVEAKRGPPCHADTVARDDAEHQRAGRQARPVDHHPLTRVPHS